MHFENVILFWNLLDTFLKEHGDFDKYKNIIELSKVQSKVVLLFDTNSSKLRKEIGSVFYNEEKNCINYFNRGEKIMLLFVRNRLVCLAQTYRNLLVFKQKYSSNCNESFDCDYKEFTSCFNLVSAIFRLY